MTRSQWVVRLIELCLNNPPANRPVSLKAPSDTKAAFQALVGYVEGLSGDLPERRT
jgi:hypothetical protein